jgi:hypothetical protein
VPAGGELVNEDDATPYGPLHQVNHALQQSLYTAKASVSLRFTVRTATASTERDVQSAVEAQWRWIAPCTRSGERTAKHELTLS